jgi:hypothetical protein
MKNLSLLFIITILASCGGNSHVLDSNENTKSCQIDIRSSGNFIVCGSEEFEVENGIDGSNGSDGTTPDLEYVEVCPNVNGSYIEVLLKLNGSYMAFLSNSNYKKQRLVVLEDNVLYNTSDGRNISFTIIAGELSYLTLSCN